MSSLLKHLSPLAPDDSGACGVFYELGGITVICDAGGCAGNVCGFDEPRWHEKRSALFSAGLRDMDAILGRDDRLVEKLKLICQQIEAPFTAIVGTPVPAVIATDFHALQRMAERKTGLPCITAATDGTKLYDHGEMLAYEAIFRQFSTEKLPVKPGRLGVIGATPLNTGLTRADRITAALKSEGWDEVVCFGMDSGLDEIRRASECAHLLVISPSGMQSAAYLHKTFGTPFSVGFPCIPDAAAEAARAVRGRRVLIVHQQFAANALRDLMQECDADAATWFMLDKAYAQPQDFRIRGEQQLAGLAQNYDVIFADAALKRVLRGFSGEWIDFPHFAVSGRLN